MTKHDSPALWGQASSKQQHIKAEFIAYGFKRIEYINNECIALESVI